MQFFPVSQNVDNLISQVRGISQNVDNLISQVRGTLNPVPEREVTALNNDRQQTHGPRNNICGGSFLTFLRRETLQPVTHFLPC